MDCEHQGVAVGATRTGVTRAAGQREGGVGRSKNSMNHPMKHNTNAQERQKEDTQTTHLAVKGKAIVEQTVASLCGVVASLLSQRPKHHHSVSKENNKITTKTTKLRLEIALIGPTTTGASQISMTKAIHQGTACTSGESSTPTSGPLPNDAVRIHAIEKLESSS